jgi:protein O-mannosyl-transferase
MSAHRSFVAPRLALVLLVAAVHANGIFGKFIFDDLRSIVTNPTVHSLTPVWRVLFGSDFATTAGRPLLNLSLALNYAVSGKEPWSYHVFNIAMHALVAWLMFEVVLKLFRLPTMPVLLREGAVPLAWTAAALWGVHPLTTSAVAYCVQRAESLCALACLGVLYSLLRHAESDNDPEPGGAGWVRFAWLCCFLGVSAKEVAATAPLIALVFDRVFLSTSWRQLLLRRGVAHAGLFASWVWLGWLMALSGGRHGTAGIGYGTGTMDYFLTQCVVVPRYLALAIFPVGLSADWGFPLYTDPAEWGPGLGLLLVLGVLTLVALVLRPKWGFVGVWFFVILGPTSSFIPLVTQTAAEHRMYLPLMGLVVGVIAALAVLLDWAGARLGSFRSAVRPGHTTGVSVGVGLLAIVACALLSIQRNALYADPEALWRDAVQARPDSARAMGNIAIAHLDRSEYAAALEWSERAVNLPRIRSRRWVNRGTSEGVATLHNLRGFALMSLEREDEALAAFDEAVDIAPIHADARLNRAGILLRRGQFDSALADCDAVLESQRNPVRALNLRGRCHLKRGDLPAAMADANTLAERGWPIYDEFANELRPLLKRVRE